MKKYYRSVLNIRTAICFGLVLWLTSCSNTLEFWNFGQESDHHTGTTPNSASMAQSKQIALLLPLSGPAGASGNAVKNGFMAAAEKSSSPVNIRVYNTADTDVGVVYRRAVAEGADCVVGPLEKEQVQHIAMMSTDSVNPVKTLALNYVDVPATPNNVSRFVYQFGLSPIDEAVQVAQYAHQNGQHSALIISPQGPWGKGVIQAFKNEWIKNGGVIAGQFEYMPSQDLGPYIRQLLQVNDGVQYKELPPEGHRRQDADMIFLAALPPKARQIDPLLKFYYAGDLPVYSISLVYSGIPSPQMDQDLNGIRFDDMPWIFDPQAAQLSHLPRLYALGMDAYTLVAKYPNWQSSQSIQGKTGVISWNGHRVNRHVIWAQFVNGNAEVIAR